MLGKCNAWLIVAREKKKLSNGFKERFILLGLFLPLLCACSSPSLSQHFTRIIPINTSTKKLHYLISFCFLLSTHGAKQSSWIFCSISSHKGLCYMGTVSISLIQLLETRRSKCNDFHMCLITQPRFGELELCCSFQTSLDVSGLNQLPK